MALNIIIFFCCNKVFTLKSNTYSVEGKFLDSDLMKELKDLRSKIMKLTLEIIRLSGERLTLAKKIGEIKAQNNMPIEDPLVEQELRSKVIDLSQKHNIDVNFSLKLLNFLIKESKRVQRNNVMLRKYKRHM